MDEAQWRQQTTAVHTADAAHTTWFAGQLDFARSLVPMIANQAWSMDGAKTLHAWLAYRYSMPRSEAWTWANRAHQLNASPATTAAVAAGALDLPLLDVLARHKATSPADVALAVAGSSPADLDAVFTQRTRDALNDPTQPPGPTPGAATHSHNMRRATNKLLPGVGLRRLTFELPIDTADLAWNALEHLAHRFGPNVETGIYDLPQQRIADAFVAACTTEVAADQATVPATIVLHHDRATLRSIINGAEVCNDTYRRLCCDARLEVVIHDEHGHPITVSDQQRTATASQKRALVHRDGPCCTFPGCTDTWFLHAHHITHWEDGGPTELWNLLHLCPHHHRAIHEGGFTIRGPATKPTFHRPDGLRVKPRNSGWYEVDQYQPVTFTPAA